MAKISPISPEVKAFIEAADEGMIKKLRLAVQPPGKRGSWLKHLSDSRLVEVFFRLSNGASPYGVAAMAQTDWGVEPKSEVKSLSRAVYKFRDKTVGDIQIAKMSVPAKDKGQVEEMSKRARKITENTHTIEYLAKAVVYQFERVETLVAREKTSIPFKFTDKAMSTLTDMVDKLTRLQIELGLLDSRPNEWNLNVQHKFAGMMQHTIGKDSEKVTAAIGKFVELLDKKALTMKIDPETGSYALKKKEDDKDGEE